MIGTSAAVQTTCRRSTYRPYRTAGRKAEYGRFSVLPRPEIYRSFRIKDSVKIDPYVGSGYFLVYAFDARLGPETLPTDVRKPIWNFQPSGWQSTRYEDLVDGGSLFNRSHLIGYQLCCDSGSRDTDEGGSIP